MTEHLRKDQGLTTTDIARGDRAREPGTLGPGTPPPHGPVEPTERTAATRTSGAPLPGGPVEARESAAETRPSGAPQGRAAVDQVERPGPLFSDSEAQELRSRWNAVQTGFVDEPRKSVEQADALVAATVKRVAEIFADERTRLENQWDRGDRISTEDLRVTLQRYRSFFTRLLSV